MQKANEFHLHIHEGATPSAVRAAVEAYHGRQSGSAANDVPDVRETEMTVEERVALAERAHRESDGKMKPLLDFLAANPDRWIPFAEASAALGFGSPRSMPGLLGAFGLRSNHRYGGRRPFETTLHDDVWHIRMDASIADAIRALRDE